MVIMAIKRLSNQKKEDTLYVIGLITAIIIPLGFSILTKLTDSDILNSVCLFDRIFHLYCPGCGGSRAMIALLKGQFIVSFWMHPVVIYSFLIYLVFMGSQLLCRISRGRMKGIRFHNWYLYGAILLILINWVVKNILRIIWDITL